MNSKETYTPDWISEEYACAWLGVDRTTLFRWRKSKGLAWSEINGRNIMYDRRQINELLNRNSTYAITGDKKLSA